MAKRDTSGNSTPQPHGALSLVVSGDTQPVREKEADQPIVTARGVIAGLLAGVVLGWALRGSMPPAKPPIPPMSPASIGSDRFSVLGKGPFAVYGHPSKQVKKKPAAKPSAPKTPVPLMPRALPGHPSVSFDSRSEGLPDPLQPVQPGDSALAISPPTQTGPDIHAIESRARVVVMDGGGRVVSASEAHGGDGQAAKTLVVTAPESRAERLVSQLRSKLGSGAMVSDPESDGSDSSPDADPMAAELAKGAQKEVDRLKEQLRQAGTAFYPDAPAYKSLQQQYADALQRLQDARKSLPARARFHIVITGS